MHENRVDDLAVAESQKRLRWEREFHKHVCYSPRCERAYLQLAKVCGTENLLRHLYFYTQPGGGRSKHEASKARDVARDLKRTLSALQKADTEVRNLVHWLKGNTLRREIGIPLQDQFVSVMRAYTERLEDLRREFARRSSLKGKLRDEVLVALLWLRVKFITGDPHWQDLAYVLNTAYEAQGRTIDLDKGSVREIIRRFSKARPADMKLYTKEVARGAFFNTDEVRSLEPPPKKSAKK